jgi:hypothetical protein
MVGSVVYEHVHELHDRGLVKSRQDGITKILQTTDRFQEYFGIEATEGDALKQELAQKVGLVLTPKAAASPTPEPGTEGSALEGTDVSTVSPSQSL